MLGVDRTWHEIQAGRDNPPAIMWRPTFVFLASAAALAAGPLSPLSFELRQTAGAVVIATARYEASFAREGAALSLRRGGEVILRGWAASRPDGVFTQGQATGKVGALLRCEQQDGGVTLDYGVDEQHLSFRIEVQPLEGRLRLVVRPAPQYGVEAAVGCAWNLESAGSWYGGGYQQANDPRIWPLNGATIVRPNVVAGDNSQATPLWYTTKGAGFWVRKPLDFGYSLNAVTNGQKDDWLQIRMSGASALTYHLLVAADLQAVVRQALDELGRPRRVPPAELFAGPIYDTWVEYKLTADQAKVLEFARTIRAHELPAGVLDIDDRWETHYGDFEFDARRFPDPKGMVAELHRLGFRVTLWVHPYVNLDSRTYREHRDDGLLLRDFSGHAGIVPWWNGSAAV